jgi:hypothetical protein
LSRELTSRRLLLVDGGIRRTAVVRRVEALLVEALKITLRYKMETILL